MAWRTAISAGIIVAAAPWLVVVFDAAQAQASPAKNNRTLTGIATQQQIRLHPATQKRKTKSGVLNVMKKNDSTQETINQNMK